MKKVIAFILAAVIYGTASADGTPPMIHGTLADGAEGVAYRSELTAEGVAPITWEVDGLPAGLEYDVNDTGEACTFSGVPQEIFSGRVRITITNGHDDASRQSYSRSVNLNIRAVTPVFREESGTRHEIAVNVPVVLRFELSESPLEVEWEYSGELPEGLMFDSDVGVICGTPIKAGDYALTVTAINTSSTSRKAVQNISILVTP